MTGREVNEASPLQRFLQNCRKSEIIFEDGSSGSQMYLIHAGGVAWQPDGTGAAE